MLGQSHEMWILWGGLLRCSVVTSGLLLAPLAFTQKLQSHCRVLSEVSCHMLS